MDGQFEIGMDVGLIWLPEKGWGYCASKGFDYDSNYFEHYADLEGTEISDRLNAVRVELVNRYTKGMVLDVGIGAGTFIKSRNGNTFGYDINPVGIDWLRRQGLFLDPYECDLRAIPAVTFWDSLEHIDPHDILNHIQHLAFISMPIYRDLEHLLSSKHFKKNEHCYYFTSDGLILWMRGYGFKCEEFNTSEVKCGREDIGAFVFSRSL